jgi:CBS-domain-containing membrane protein
LPKVPPHMTAARIYKTEFPMLEDTETVAEATRRMLANNVSDLPVVDASGAFIGMFKLERLFKELLPSAATMGLGMSDLTFVSSSIDQLRERMRGIEGCVVRDFVVEPEHVLHAETTPLEAVLLLYKGANAIPVVAADGKLAGMVSARDVLAALQPAGAA